MQRKKLAAVACAMALLTASCGTEEAETLAVEIRDFNGNIVDTSDPSVFGPQSTEVPAATTSTAVPVQAAVEESEDVPTRLGTAPVIFDDLESEGCNYVPEERLNEIIDPEDDVYFAFPGLSRFGSCTYLRSGNVENTVYITIAPLQRASFFDAGFNAAYHTAGDPITGNTREVIEENYGDESYLFLSPTLGPEFDVNIDGVNVSVNIDTLDDNSDESERIEDAREIMEHILGIS